MSSKLNILEMHPAGVYLQLPPLLPHLLQEYYAPPPWSQHIGGGGHSLHHQILSCSLDISLSLFFPNIRKFFRNKYYITEVNVVVSSSVQVFKISPVSITAKHLKISNVNVGWVGWGGGVTINLRIRTNMSPINPYFSTYFTTEQGDIKFIRIKRDFNSRKIEKYISSSKRALNSELIIDS